MKYTVLAAIALAAPQTTTVVKTPTNPAPVKPATTKKEIGSSPPTSTGTTEPVGAEYQGNCLTQRLDFKDPSRIFALDGMDAMRNIKELDTARYDFTIDYFKNQVKMMPEGGVELSISKPADATKNPDAPRLSTTRFMLRGKISAYLKAPAIKGVVTTFIAMGPNLPDSELDLSKTDKNGGDEIDWEIVGGAPTEAQSNIFYRGFKEYAIRGGVAKVDSIENFHKYTIDWKKEEIQFLIDDVLVRTYFKNSTQADSVESKTRRFFPDRATKVQFALWSEATNAWAGGAAVFPPGTNTAVAQFQYVDIQCYDDNDQPVPQWPLTDLNPPFKATISNQPVQGVNGKVSLEAGPSFTGKIGSNGKCTQNCSTGAALSSSLTQAAVFSLAFFNMIVM
jgi:beta-glucanase (GH16 family)